MSFTVGDVVVPRNSQEAEVVRVDPGTRLVVRDHQFAGLLTLAKESDGSPVSNFWAPERFVLAGSSGIARGDRVVIRGDRNATGSTYVTDGDTGTVSRRGRGGTTVVDLDNGGNQTVFTRCLEVLAEPEKVETLAEYKIKFLNMALARGRDNGVIHQGQVETALSRLAGFEYLDPSQTVEDFQKRVAALAMEAKGKHNWCDEPEKFLTEIGLGHLIQKKEKVRVTVEVEVDRVSNGSRRLADANVRAGARGLVYDALGAGTTITDVVIVS